MVYTQKQKLKLYIKTSVMAYARSLKSSNHFSIEDIYWRSYMVTITRNELY